MNAETMDEVADLKKRVDDLRGFL